MRTWIALLALGTAATVGPAVPAGAHQTSLKATMVEAPGSTSAVAYGPRTRALLSLGSGGGGRIKLKVKRAEDGSGARATALGNHLRMDVVLNGAAETWRFPFDLVNGNGKISKVFLGLFSPDIIEIVDVALEDAGGEAFGVLGFVSGVGPSRALASAMVQVEEGSFIRLAPSRDADVSIRAKHGGNLKVRFDKLEDALGNAINSVGNRLEVEVDVNGTAPVSTTAFFDVVDDNGEADVALPGLLPGDVVRVRRIDAYDPLGDRFATLGVRIRNPRLP